MNHTSCKSTDTVAVTALVKLVELIGQIIADKQKSAVNLTLQLTCFQFSETSFKNMQWIIRFGHTF